MSETTFLSAVLFLLFALISGSLIQWLVSKVKSYKPPVSILWFAFGMLICLVEVLVVPEHRDPDHGQLTHVDINPEHPLGLLGIGIAEASRVHSSVLYYVVLPILLYDATQQISWHHFRKSLKTGVLLAIVGVVFQVVVIGLLMQYSFTRPAAGASGLFDASSVYATENNELHEQVVRDLGPDFPIYANDGLIPQLAFNVSSIDEVPLEPPLPPAAARRGLGFLWRGPKVQHKHAALDDEAKALGLPHVPTLSFSMMTSAAVASTDPIAVINILEEMEAPAQFASLFDSEALINDGSSIFLFTFFKSLTRGKQQTWQESIGRFATLLIVGPLFGFFSASLMYRWLKHYRWFPYDKTLAVVFASYLVFFIAEIYLTTSGPLAIVVYGLYFKAYAKAAFEADAVEVHHHFVRGCATAATSVVFIISGIASLRMMWDALTAQANLALPDDLPELEPEGVGLPQLARASVGRGRASSELWRVPVFYFYLLVARFLMIGIFYPLIRRFLGGFTWKEYVLLSWGGLRGAVCLILGLLIEQDEHIDRDLSASAALYIASSAFLILFTNGITFEWLYKLLRPYKANAFRRVYLKKVMKLVDKEYYNEVALLQQHWLFERSWALVYADRLIPRLGSLNMDKFGKIHISCPHAPRVLRDFDEQELARVLPHPEPASRLPSPAASVRRAGAAAPSEVRINIISRSNPSSPRPPARDGSKSVRGEEVTGHSTAAVLQRLRRPPESGLDLESNLRVLNNEEEELTEEVEYIISRQNSKLEDEHRRQLSSIDNEPASAGDGAPLMPIPSSSVPPLMELGRYSDHHRIGNSRQDGASGGGGLGSRRIPGYRYDSIVRIRSEPYSGLLDAAQLERWESVLHQAGETGCLRDDQRNATSDRVPNTIPRAMSVPHNLDVLAAELGAAYEQDQTTNPQPLLAKDREGEMLIMTINTMRQQYAHMYEQCFISGTVFVGFMATADIIADFAMSDLRRRAHMRCLEGIVSEGRKNTNTRCGCIKVHRDVCERPEVIQQRIADLTGFEVEWRLSAARLRANTRRRWTMCQALYHFVCCGARKTKKTANTRERSTRQRRWRMWVKARWTSLWSALGPRQTFPALDDLQLICAFVDVHEELLLRGDSGLRTMLGPRLLTAFEDQTLKAKLTVHSLMTRYPDSFPYAMICHAAIFLLNLKIQLTEEQYERGLLLADDKEKICTVLKEQLVAVSKFHPPFLFT